MTAETLPLSPFLPGTNIQFASTEEERIAKYLISNVIVNGECWECHLAPVKKGYCYVQVGGRRGLRWRAHRLIWIVINGQIKDCILHSCDNRRCIRPSHLFEGTEKDNTQDMIKKGRHKYVTGNNRKIDESSMGEVIFMRNAGLSYDEIGQHFRVSASTIMNNLRRYANG